MKVCILTFENFQSKLKVSCRYSHHSTISCTVVWGFSHCEEWKTNANANICQCSRIVNIYSRGYTYCTSESIRTVVTDMMQDSDHTTDIFLTRKRDRCGIVWWILMCVLTVRSRMQESSSEDDDAYFFAICEKEYSLSIVLTHPWKRICIQCNPLLTGETNKIGWN